MTAAADVPIGIAMPTNRIRLHGVELRHTVARLEAAGCESLWVNDHLALFPAGTDDYPYSGTGRIDWDPAAPQYEALTACAYLAALTETMRIGTSVLILPQRHPVEVSKMAATLADFSGGRFVLGVGAGWSRREMRLLGWDRENRGTRMDEQLDIIRSSWGDGNGYPQGPHYGVDADVILEPQPLAGQVPLILVGGNSPGALRRARLRGDGWLPVSPADRAALLALGEKLAALRAEASRPLRGVIKVILDEPDPSYGAEFVTWLAGQGWDEITFEFKKWDLEGACDLVQAATSRR
jgi:probable F420-dependent oxidoreductase